MATAKKEENPSKTPDQQRQPQPYSAPPIKISARQQPPSSTTGSSHNHKDGDESKSSTTRASVGATAGKKDEPVSDVQKRIRRAERFGTPVQLSEEEKRNSRAE
ncbi:hypothetical protein U1Q18_013225, partial [Sarracenia purpurea var. burkii]